MHLRRIKMSAFTATAVILMAAMMASSASAGVVTPSQIGVGAAYCTVTASGPTLVPPPDPQTSILPTNALGSSGCPFGTAITNSSPLILTVDDTAGTLVVYSGTIRVGFIPPTCDITFFPPGVSIPRVPGSRRYQRNVPISTSSPGIRASGGCATQIDLNLYLT